MEVLRLIEIRKYYSKDIKIYNDSWTLEMNY